MVATEKARRPPPAAARKKAVAKPAAGKSASPWTEEVLDRTAASREAVAEAKRLALIRAAGRAFRAKGFHQTSLDDVAASLNVTKPTLYYHVKGKQDLLYQCHAYALDLGEQALAYGLAGETGLAKLERTLARYIELLTEDFSAYSVLSDLKDLAPEQFESIQSRRRKFDAVFRGFVRSGIEDGSIRDCDPAIAVAWFMGAVNAIPRWFSEGGRYGGRELARQYLDLIANGLRPR